MEARAVLQIRPGGAGGKPSPLGKSPKPLLWKVPRANPLIIGSRPSRLDSETTYTQEWGHGMWWKLPNPYS